MGRISAEKRREILSDYEKYGTYSKVSRLHKVSMPTVKRIVLSGKTARRQDDAPCDVMEHISKNSQAVCELIDKYLAVMNDPARLENAPLNQVASALGVLVDKFTRGTVKDKTSTDLDRVIEAVRKIE